MSPTAPLYQFIHRLIKNPRPKAIYLHIPFCDKRCGFCYYYSFSGISNEHKSLYVDGLLNEMRIYQQKFRIGDRDVRSIYVGGGTPTDLDYHSLKKLLGGIRQYLMTTKIKNYTFEVNPEIVEHQDGKQKLDLLSSYGVNRISFGVQSFLEKELRRNNVRHRKKHIYKFLKWVFPKYNNFSIDLMIGLIDQSEDSFARSFLELLNIFPPHFAIYDIIYREGTQQRQYVEAGYQNMLDKKEQIRLMNITRRICTELGFIGGERAYSNYHKNVFTANQWSLQWDIVGLGLSARSMYVTDNIVFRNVCSLGLYLQTINSNLIPLEYKTINYDLRKVMQEDLIKYFFPTTREFKKNGSFQRAKGKHINYLNYIYEGILWENIGAHSIALKVYKHASGILVSHFLSYFCIFSLLLRWGKIEDAIRYIGKVSARNSSPLLLARMYYFLGRTFLAKSKLRQAVAMFNKATEAYSFDIDSIYWLAYCYWRKKKTKLSLKYLNHYIKLNPEEINDPAKFSNEQKKWQDKSVSSFNRLSPISSVHRDLLSLLKQQEVS